MPLSGRRVNNGDRSEMTSSAAVVKSANPSNATLRGAAKVGGWSEPPATTPTRPLNYRAPGQAGAPVRSEICLAPPTACALLPRSRRVFPWRAVIDEPVRDGSRFSTADLWHSAIGPSGATREGAANVEATRLVDPSKWSTGTRLTL